MQKWRRRSKKFFKDYPEQFDPPKLIKGKTSKKKHEEQVKAYFLLFNYMNDAIFSLVYLDILEVRISFVREHLRGEEMETYAKS